MIRVQLACNHWRLYNEVDPRKPTSIGIEVRCKVCGYHWEIIRIEATS